MRLCKLSVAPLLALAGLLAPTALADDDHYRGELDIEIDHLKADLRLSGDTWLVDAGYEVDVEGRNIPGGLALLLTVTDAGRTIAAPTGEPIELIVPLEYPTDVDDDELEFKGAAIVALEDGSFSHPANLRLHGYIVLPDADQPLAGKTTEIDFHEPVYYGGTHVRTTHVGVSIGVHRSPTYVYRPPTIVRPYVVYRDYSYCRPVYVESRPIPYHSRVVYQKSIVNRAPVVRIQRSPSVRVAPRPSSGRTIRSTPPTRTPVIRVKKKP